MDHLFSGRNPYLSPSSSSSVKGPLVEKLFLGVLGAIMHIARRWRPIPTDCCKFGRWAEIKGFCLLLVFPSHSLSFWPQYSSSYLMASLPFTSLSSSSHLNNLSYTQILQWSVPGRRAGGAQMSGHEGSLRQPWAEGIMMEETVRAKVRRWTRVSYLNSSTIYQKGEGTFRNLSYRTLNYEAKISERSS